MLMNNFNVYDKNYIAPQVRLLIMLTGLFIAIVISYHFTGSPLPVDAKNSLVFQNALLLIVLGSAITEKHFTKPSDSLINSLMGVITLVSVYSIAPQSAWFAVFIYCVIVFISAFICMSLISSANGRLGVSALSKATYGIAVTFGRAQILYSVIFIFGLYSFFNIQSPQTVSLVVFWGLFLAIWPLSIPQLISKIIHSTKTDELESVGALIRTDDPNVAYFGIAPDTKWMPDKCFLYQMIDETQSWVLPIHSQIQNERLIGTALVLGPSKSRIAGTTPGHLFDTGSISLSELEVMQYLNEDQNARIVGFVREDSEISSIKFEAIKNGGCHDGMLIWSNINGKKVYFQITNGLTYEENLEGDRHGFHIGVAAQLGVLDNVNGFLKYDWVPDMNSPLFCSKQSDQQLNAAQIGQFGYGKIPYSEISVCGDFLNNYNHHTAILGVTGSGKTELAFDLIKHAVTNGIKVICVDLTSQYKGRMADLSPQDLSIENKLANELSEKLFAVETGTYGAPAEKKALSGFSKELTEQISKRVEEFITSSGESHRLGLIQLEEISNTKATLWITQLYLSCLLNYARSNNQNCPKILIVLEEAHTVIPEASTMGLGDSDSKGIVGKIAQIALQGRKYGVGLLVLTQRTATVSKTVLTQCNTVISFTGYDDTSMNFLRNVIGDNYVRMIPNLRPLQAVIFGKGVKSQRPILVNIPFNQEKANLS